ncbi:MAG: hypothetical protein GXP55_07290 [Deltaproteobacteria bacterium]|nr:hypothetical protein [Deltaproteobacteria bacterium]
MFSACASPGLARADRGRPARVDALTGGLGVPDDATRQALSEALALLPASGRLRLLESVRADAQAARSDPGPWLAEALAQETHPGVLRAMLERLDSAPAGTRAWTSPGSELTRVLFVRPSAPGAYEWLELRRASHGPDGRLCVSAGVDDPQTLTLRAEGLVPVHPRRLAARVAPLLYRHRQLGGELPPQARVFAKLF